MSSTTTYGRYPISHVQRRGRRSRTRSVTTWLVKAFAAVGLGVAGYLFITAFAVPGLVEGIFGAR
jgi:hypothetical protein